MAGACLRRARVRDRAVNSQFNRRGCKANCYHPTRAARAGTPVSLLCCVTANEPSQTNSLLYASGGSAREDTRSMSAVLVVEDEQHLADGLRFNLEAEGYTVDAVSDGEAALSLFFDKRQTYDALVLDVMLPGKDGFTVAAELRAAGYFVPVLMLTARGRPEDVLRGFESGADDYLPKPFELSVLLARLNALLRRRQWFHLDQTQEQRTRAGLEARETDQEDSASGNEREEFVFNNRVIDFGNLELRTPQ